MNSPGAGPVLRVRDLCVSFPSRSGRFNAVDRVSFELRAGEVLGLVGETGSGKSMTGAALMGMVPRPVGAVSFSELVLDGQSLENLTEREWRTIRGKRISTIFQEPMTALDPVFTIGSQVSEVIRRHQACGRAEANRKAMQLLGGMGLTDEPHILRSYPHQLSGGMRQRVMIAMAMACHPRVLIADEPTSALDVTTQLQILDQLRELARTSGTAILLITHDLGVVAQTCESALVMHQGRIVERGPVRDLFRSPQHDYTSELLAALPQPLGQVEDTPLAAEPGRGKNPKTTSTPLLRVKDLRMKYAARRAPGGRFQPAEVVRGVSLELEAGQIFGLVGESGCGKTSLARCIVRLSTPIAGTTRFREMDLGSLRGRELRAARQKIQYLFQDPHASLNPRRTIMQMLAEPLELYGICRRNERRKHIEQALNTVELGPEVLARYPHELSGGQRQRLALARALLAQPELIIADEPLSSLDVSVRSRIMLLIDKVRSEKGIAFVLISHDLAVVQQLADYVAVMYLGEFVESGPADSVFSRPAHPYTQALIAASPRGLPQAEQKPLRLTGEPPTALTLPGGCVFHTRCPQVMERCVRERPADITISARPDTGGPGFGQHVARCHLWDS